MLPSSTSACGELSFSAKYWLKHEWFAVPCRLENVSNVGERQQIYSLHIYPNILSKLKAEAFARTRHLKMEEEELNLFYIGYRQLTASELNHYDERNPPPVPYPFRDQINATAYVSATMPSCVYLTPGEDAWRTSGCKVSLSCMQIYSCALLFIQISLLLRKVLLISRNKSRTLCKLCHHHTWKSTLVYKRVLIAWRRIPDPKSPDFKQFDVQVFGVSKKHNLPLFLPGCVHHFSDKIYAVHKFVMPPIIRWWVVQEQSFFGWLLKWMLRLCKITRSRWRSQSLLTYRCVIVFEPIMTAIVMTFCPPTKHATAVRTMLDVPCKHEQCRSLVGRNSLHHYRASCSHEHETATIHHSS